MSTTYRPDDNWPEFTNPQQARLRREFSSIKRAEEGDKPSRRFTVLHAAPEKSGGGDFVFADGSDWDPGYGEGLYYRDEANTGFRPVGQFVTFRNFGAKGDGVTDDTAAIARALDSGVKVIDGNGLTYAVSAAYSSTTGGITIRNAKFLVTALANSTPLMKWSGSDGTPQTLASNYTAPTYQMTVPDGTAFTVGEWAWLASTEYWAAAAADDVTYGEMVLVTQISGNVLTFGASTLLSYTTAKSATITPMSLLESVRLENVTVTGLVSTGNQSAFWFDRCKDARLVNVNSTDCDYGHLVFERCANTRIRDGSASRTGVQEGLDYGVVVSAGCFDLLLDGYHANGMRHIITIGGSAGVCRHIRAINCTGYNLTDAGMDSHSAVHEHTFAFNTLHFADDVDTTMDGINVSGTAPIVVGNQIHNCKRHGVLWSPETLAAFTGPISGVFDDNIINIARNTGSVYGLNVQTPASGTSVAAITAVNADNLQVYGASAVALIQANVSAIGRVSVTSGKALSPMRSRGIYVFANASDIDDVEIIGGHYETDDITTSPVIDIAGGASNWVKHARVSAAHMKRGSAGTIGLRFIRTQKGRETGVTTDNVTTKYSVDADSDATLDLRTSSFVVNTSTTYTVLAQDRCVISSVGSSVTLTLPDATKNKGRDLYVKTLTAQTVVSASSNVAPIGTTVAGTAILPATAGAWSLLVSDGTIWHVMQRGT